MLAAKLPTRSIGVTPSNSIALAFRASPAPASVIAVLLPRSNKIVQKPDSCPFVQLFLSYQAINLSHDHRISPAAPSSRLHRTPKAQRFFRLGARVHGYLQAENVNQRVRLTIFRMNTCKSVSKQRTLSIFRMNTCEK